MADLEKDEINLKGTDEEMEDSKEEYEIDEEESISITSFVFEWANAFMVALIVVVLLLTFVFRQVTVSGTSMTDTLADGDRLIISSFMYTPQYGDIIVVSHGENYSNPIIKRVIATEGQALSINYQTGDVSVDGVILDEKYIKGNTIPLKNPLDIPDKIPEGYVFVMGDNREGSLDSRSNDIGLIPVENIIGKAELRIFPISGFGSVYS